MRRRLECRSTRRRTTASCWRRSGRGLTDSPGLAGALCFSNANSWEGTTSMRIALYGRVSTKDKGQDTENQMLQLREFARVQGWEIAHEYVDYVTGKRSDRAEFQRMFADAARRRFDLVLFWSLDRFSREGAL